MNAIAFLWGFIADHGPTLVAWFCTLFGVAPFLAMAGRCSRG